MSYCNSLKTSQVEQVLIKEATNSPSFDGPDLSLYHEAREELSKRGVDPDEVLNDRGIKAPSYEEQLQIIKEVKGE